jgi:hypothetical protein
VIFLYINLSNIILTIAVSPTLSKFFLYIFSIEQFIVFKLLSKKNVYPFVIIGILSNLLIIFILACIFLLVLICSFDIISPIFILSISFVFINIISF